MAEKARSSYDYEAYLALEAASEVKYEYHDGTITAMAGGTPEHGLITANVIRGLGNALEDADKPCRVYSSDVKVHIETHQRTFYPDGSVVCGPTERASKDVNAITNPVLILEVLSESTATFDLGAKFSHYRQLPSLREYLLVSQSEVFVTAYHRTTSQTWEIHTYTQLSDKVLLKSLGIGLSVERMYRMVSGMER